MASERLSHVLESFVAALAEANASLADQHQGQVSYLITELDASIGYGRLELGDEGPLVDLDDRGQEASGKLIKLRISPVSRAAEETAEEPEEPQQPNPREPRDIKGLRLEEGLRAIARAGLPTDQVVVAFDPASDQPAGAVVDYKMERDPAGRGPRFVFTVAGRPPEGGEPGRPVIR